MILIAIIAAIGCGVFAIFFPEGTLGWILGAIIGLFVFRNRVNTIVKLPQLPQEDWAKASIKASLTTYALMIAAVLIGIYVEPVNPYAVIGGILLERIVLRADGWLRPGALSDIGMEEQSPSTSEANT